MEQSLTLESAELVAIEDTELDVVAGGCGGWKPPRCCGKPRHGHGHGGKDIDVDINVVNFNDNVIKADDGSTINIVINQG